MDEAANQKFGIRTRPRREGGQKTFQLILTTTAQLMEEVGFDTLTTNLICEKAGVTPPALYRYFPNKHAVLEELGSSLMSIQNEVSFKWMEEFRGKEIQPDDHVQLLRDQYNVTVKYGGAKWIMRSLRSVPVLADVRFRSHELMNKAFTQWYLEEMPFLHPEKLARHIRISNELGYALIEMLLDGDYDDAEETFQDASLMFAALTPL